MIHQLNQNVYVLTKQRLNQHLNAYSYLIIDQDEAILIEPGSLSDFDEIYQDILSLIDPSIISYVIISHPDPDLTSSLPLFEKKLKPFTIVTEWRTKEIIDFYGLTSDYYLIRNHALKLSLKSGREFVFILTPFAHYSGSFMTLDMSNKFLYSGDLFGGISTEKSLFSDENYLESMAAFHENYLPSSDFLRPVMKEVSNYQIEMICPQHGSIIKKEMVDQSIQFLHQLEFFNTPKQIHQFNNDPNDIDFEHHLTQVILRLMQIHTKDQILNTFLKSPIQIFLDPIKISTSLKGYQLWNRFFDIIYSKRGDDWLNGIETLIQRISHSYKISMPKIYETRSHDLEEKTQELMKKYQNLEDSYKSLDKEISLTKDQLLRCKITGLYQKDKARLYLVEHLDELINQGYIYHFDIDQLIDINQAYSVKVGDDTMNSVKYIISNALTKDETLYRGSGSSFILIGRDKHPLSAINRAEELRNMINKSDRFIIPISISIGVLALRKIDFVHPDQIVNDWFFEVEKRLSQAKAKGKNQIVFEEKEDLTIYKNQILLVDEEQINVNLITHYFKDEAIRVFHAKNPIEAMQVIEKQRIDLVISEINLSKLDGFSLKKQLNDQIKYAKIPFILLSHMKNETLIQRANRLNVDYFLKKPFFMAELIGLVKRGIR